MTESASKSMPESARLTAAVVDPSDTDAPPYGMFALERVTVEEAFLAGSIFFEAGEEFTVEIAGGRRGPVRVRAKVVAHERGPRPGMTIRFQGLSAAERDALGELERGR